MMELLHGEENIDSMIHECVRKLEECTKLHEGNAKEVERIEGYLADINLYYKLPKNSPLLPGKDKIAQDRVLILEARELLRVRDESLQGFEESLRNGIKVYLEVKERNSAPLKG